MRIHLPSFTDSPRNQFLTDLTILFASYQIDQVKTHFAEDIVWTLVGDKPVHGKEAFAAELNRMAGNSVTELVIHSILTQGREAAVHGEMAMADGKRFGFADVYVFTGEDHTTIQSITSYIVQIPFRP